MPKLLGDYEILEELGRGGMGVVYKARHRRLKKLVALKVLRPDWAANRHALERFTREIEAVGRLHHANLVAATDAREDAGFCFLVMEYVEGRNLAALVRRCGRLAVADACEIARQVALGLEHSYRQGLVHRDIQPSNVMLATDGTVKVLDMGLARLQDSLAPAQGLTSSGQLLGNPDYVSPEQACGEAQIDIRSDIYGLGCTPVLLLIGVPPFGSPDHASFAAKVAAHLHKPFPSISTARGDVPRRLQDLLQRMVAKEREERFANPAEVVAALTPFCEGGNLAALSSAEGRDLRTHDPTPRPIAPDHAVWPPRGPGGASRGRWPLVHCCWYWRPWRLGEFGKPFTSCRQLTSIKRFFGFAVMETILRFKSCCSNRGRARAVRSWTRWLPTTTSRFMRSSIARRIGISCGSTRRASRKWSPIRNNRKGSQSTRRDTNSSA